MLAPHESKSNSHDKLGYNCLPSPIPYFTEICSLVSEMKSVDRLSLAGSFHLCLGHFCQFKYVHIFRIVANAVCCHVLIEEVL
jgi:hypothetical protein